MHSTDSIQSLSKYKWHFYQNYNRNFKFGWRHKRLQILKAILKKKNGAGGIKLPDFRLYQKATVIKTGQYCHKSRYIDQWNRIENSEINPHTCGQLLYHKGGRLYNGEKTSLSINGAGKTGHLHVKKMKFKHSLTPCININSKWIKIPHPAKQLSLCEPQLLSPCLRAHALQQEKPWQ